MQRSVLAALAMAAILLSLPVSSSAQPADPAAALGFSPDPVSARQVERAVLARLLQTNPQAARTVAQLLAGKDISASFEQNASRFGLHDGNLADAVAAREIMMRMRQTGSAAPSPEQVQQQRETSARSLATQPGAQSEAKRREVAEIAQIGFLVEYAAWQQMQHGHADLPPAGAAVPPAGSPQPPATTDATPPASAADNGTGQIVAPIGAATMSTGGFTPMGSTLRVEAWYLYPNGIATNCSTHDPATLPISLPALRAMRDCTGARWRRVGNKIQIQETDRDAWSDALSQPPQPPGTHIQFLGETAGGAGTMPGTAGISVNTVDSGRLLLTADGRIRGVLSSGTAIGGAGIGGGSSHSTRLDGTYTIDGYVMTIHAGGQTYHRLVTVVHESGKVYVYFQDREYWPPDR